jgi:hypothetical protein
MGQWTSSGSDISFSSGKVGIGTNQNLTSVLNLNRTDGYSSMINLNNRGVNNAEIGVNASALAFYAKNGAFQSFWTGTTLTERVRIDANGNVGIGTTNPGSYKLAVEGKIGAREVVVTTAAWADHVFKPGYKRMSLSEIDEFIKTNRHLPGIPTEKEVRENGVPVGAMQAKLLEKVEELTLEMIAMKKENMELIKRVQYLDTKLSKK